MNFTPDQYAKFIESLKVTTEVEGRDWPEDFADENGNYQNKCSQCGYIFIGYKRRVVCKRCTYPRFVHGIDMRMPISELRQRTGLDQFVSRPFIEYLVTRIFVAESNAKSSDLAEQVKGFMRAGMDAAFTNGAVTNDQTYEKHEAWRKLSEATEVKP
jgi:ribosomal protein S27AE